MSGTENKDVKFILCIKPFVQFVKCVDAAVVVSTSFLLVFWYVCVCEI